MKSWTGHLGWALPLLLVLGCQPQQQSPEMGVVPTNDSGTSLRVAAAAKHVILVSIDGLRADMITPHITPTLMTLRTQGASTLNARTDPTRANTVPNHICMITGLPTEGVISHNYTQNFGSEGTVHDQAGRVVHTAFDVAHRGNLRTAMWLSKEKLRVLVRTITQTTHAPDAVGINDHNDEATVNQAVAGLSGPTPPELAMIHFSAPDSAGHANGFDPHPGSPYQVAVTQTDTRIAALVAALPTNSVIIVTTDHGGHGFGHGDMDEPADFTIPLIVVGGGAQPATDLYALNPGSRAHPGRRPSWGGEPVRNCELGNLTVRLLGLTPIPGSIFGGRFDLRVAPAAQ